MKRLAVLGASGHGRVVADIAESNGWDEVVFFDDAWPESKVNGGLYILGNSNSLIDNLPEFSGVAVAIGDNAARARKLEWLINLDAPVVSLLHPSSVISKSTDLGVGVVVMPGAVINSLAKIGIGVIINTSCSIDHDCLIGDYCHISPGAHLAGGVEIGAGSWVGIGASVTQLVTIGQNVIVGAGAVVIADVPADSKVVGVPAKPV